DSVKSKVLLTPTELRILEILMKKEGERVRRDIINYEIWGDINDDNRVDVYIRRIRRKVEAQPKNPTYLRTIRGEGYMFLPPHLTQVEAIQIAAD
ncbi:MAG TPA: helix-turn-helix domain-containing protein, partial [Candidatus Woesebacteria bacterium]|nr:helix-turn-helix domain-containing protein [Candidatus Woesebacteria bacterium]